MIPEGNTTQIRKIRLRSVERNMLSILRFIASIWYLRLVSVLLVLSSSVVVVSSATSINAARGLVGPYPTGLNRLTRFVILDFILSI